MIIADTNVVSELMREAPAPSVLSWVQDLPAQELTICVITVEEIERGLGRMPHGARREDLSRRWDGLMESFADAIIPYDVVAAHATARLLITSLDMGHPMSHADAQIAGICMAHSAMLATRNIKDFSHIRKLALVNPFA